MYTNLKTLDDFYVFMENIDISSDIFNEIPWKIGYLLDKLNDADKEKLMLECR